MEKKAPLSSEVSNGPSSAYTSMYTPESNTSPDDSATLENFLGKVAEIAMSIARREAAGRGKQLS